MTPTTPSVKPEAWTPEPNMTLGPVKSEPYVSIDFIGNGGRVETNPHRGVGVVFIQNRVRVNFDTQSIFALREILKRLERMNGTP